MNHDNYRKLEAIQTLLPMQYYLENYGEIEATARAGPHVSPSQIGKSVHQTMHWRIQHPDSHGIRTVAPNVVPLSIAVCALTASFNGYS